MRFPLPSESPSADLAKLARDIVSLSPVRMINYILVRAFQVAKSIQILITRDPRDSVYRKSCKLIPVATSDRGQFRGCASIELAGIPQHPCFSILSVKHCSVKYNRLPILTVILISAFDINYFFSFLFQRDRSSWEFSFLIIFNIIYFFQGSEFINTR